MHSNLNSRCRVSGSTLTEVIDFGPQPLGNGFLPASGVVSEFSFPMKLGFAEDSRMVQLFDQPEPELMFNSSYPFFSSLSAGMRNHFKNLAVRLISEFGLKNQDEAFVVEIGSNDGVFLKQFASEGIRHLGVDPSSNVVDLAESSGVASFCAFFDSKTAQEILGEHGKAKIIYAANVMCHLSDILSVAQGIASLLHSDGQLIFEDPYLGDVIERLSFDQIYDEHVFLFSAMSVCHLFAEFGLELVKVERLETHGGSMRYFLSHKGSVEIDPSVTQAIEFEKGIGLDRHETYGKWAANVSSLRDSVREEIQLAKARGLRIAGYAATSKSTTVLNYCDLGPSDIEYIADLTPEKIGLVSPGKHIPIVGEDVFESSPPDIAFLFAWNHSLEIKKRLRWFEDSGGRWFTHVPLVSLR